MSIFRRACLGLVTSVATAAALVTPLSAQQQQKPNILVITGDDIGYWNISAGAADDFNCGCVAVQPPIRSVQLIPTRSRRLCQVVHRARVCTRPGAGDRGATPHEFPAVSAETKTRFILRRTGDGKAKDRPSQQLNSADSDWRVANGGKVLSSRTRRSGSRASALLRLAAVTVGRTDTALGAFYRRLSARIGKAKAITATARKIAVLFYSAVRHGMEYVDPGSSYYETRYRTRVVENLHRRAKAFGFVLLPLEFKAGAVS